MESFRDDLLRARAVQRSFLPEFERERAGVQVAGEYRPAHAVGGDFYDVVHLRDGRVTALIGDVAGKGIAAALLMARVSTECRRLAGDKVGPRRILERVDAYLATQSLSDSFVTAACVQLQTARRRWVACNAGHVAPLLRRRSGEVLTMTNSARPALPLGLGLAGFPGVSPYVEDEIPAEPGDVMLLVTDGVLEMLGVPHDHQGHRLAELLGAAADLDDLCRRVFDAAENSPAPPRDDAALLALAVTDSALPAAATRRLVLTDSADGAPVL
jgi:sigma-B regulation protein RsbU (phosphoserine phosphatase)